MAPKGWDLILQDEFAKPYWNELQSFVAAERARGPVYPAEPEVLAALELTPYDEVKVVILGQDPYHGPGQAHGLCFSVQPPTKPPPSLRNIYKELGNDLGIKTPEHGSLLSWARAGALLLNTTLTVRDGEAASHQKKGWETFTDRIITAVSEKSEPVVFVLWGAAAQKKTKLIDTARHHVVTSAHPSPLSAHRGFFGSKPFSLTNALLRQSGRHPMDWSLPAQFAGSERT